MDLPSQSRPAFRERTSNTMPLACELSVVTIAYTHGASQAVRAHNRSCELIAGRREGRVRPRAGAARARRDRQSDSRGREGEETQDSSRGEHSRKESTAGGWTASCESNHAEMKEARPGLQRSRSPRPR